MSEIALGFAVGALAGLMLLGVYMDSEMSRLRAEVINLRIKLHNLVAERKH